MAALRSDETALGREETPVRVTTPAYRRAPEQPLHQETVSAGGLQRAIILTAAGIFLVAALFGPGVRGGGRIVLSSALIGLALLTLIVAWVFKDIQVRLWPDRLTIQQGPFIRRVPIENIRDASFGKRSLWHVKRDDGNLTRNNAAYYVNRFGTAVIVDREDGRPIVFSSHEPRVMVDAIVAAIGGQDMPPTRVGLEEIEGRSVT